MAEVTKDSAKCDLCPCPVGKAINKMRWDSVEVCEVVRAGSRESMWDMLRCLLPSAIGSTDRKQMSQQRAAASMALVKNTSGG